MWSSCDSTDFVQTGKVNVIQTLLISSGKPVIEMSFITKLIIEEKIKRFTLPSIKEVYSRLEFDVFVFGQPRECLLKMKVRISCAMTAEEVVLLSSVLLVVTGTKLTKVPAHKTPLSNR